MNQSKEGSNDAILADQLSRNGELSMGPEGLSVSVPTGHERVDAALEALASRERDRWVLRGVVAVDWLGSLADRCPEHFWKWPHAEHFLGYCRSLAPESSATSIRVERLSDDAQELSKSRWSDSGYDLTIIGIRKKFGAVVLYGTGLIVEPPEGYYFDVVARSSLMKTGYMLANNVGIIDRAYRGELMIPLFKFDSEAKEMILPRRVAQLIPRPIVHFSVEYGKKLTYTSRGTGGFGSTDRPPSTTEFGTTK